MLVHLLAKHAVNCFERKIIYFGMKLCISLPALENPTSVSIAGVVFCLELVYLTTREFISTKT